MVGFLNIAGANAQDLLLAALDATEDGFAVHRLRRQADGTVDGFTLVLINRAGAATFAETPEELVGEDLANLLPPSSAPLLEALRRCAETGLRQQVRITFTGNPAAGTCDSIVVPLDPDHVLSSWRDVSDQVIDVLILEEALRHRGSAWQVLSTILDGVGDAVVAVDPPSGNLPLTAETGAHSQVVFANAVAAAALGASPARLRGRTLNELLGHTWAKSIGRLVSVAATSGEASERVVVTLLDGRHQEGRVITARSVDKGRVVIVSRDISDELAPEPPHSKN